MLQNTLELPSMEKFKLKAKQLKITENYEKLGHSQNVLAQKYGFKDFNSIKPRLVENDSKFNKLSSKIKTYQLANGGIVNLQGLYKTKDNYSTSANSTKSSIPKNEIKKALYFIDNVMEKRKNVNLKGSTSYGLKHYAEAYIKHYKLFEADYYISNGAFIVALDIRGYEIRELNDDIFYSLNIATNYKSFRGNFDDKLKKGDFDYIEKSNDELSIIDNLYQLKRLGYKDIFDVKTTYFEILKDNYTKKDFFQYFGIYLFHFAKASNIANESSFFLEVKKSEFIEKFSPKEENIQFILSQIKQDTTLSIELLGFSFNIFFDDMAQSFIIYWKNKKVTSSNIPVLYNDKKYLVENKFFHTFGKNGEYEFQGMIQFIDSSEVQLQYFDWESGELLEEVHKISFDKLDNFIFYETDEEMRIVQKLVNDISNKDGHLFFTKDKNGFQSAKKLNQKNKGLIKFILKNVYGYSLDFLDLSDVYYKN